MAEDGEKLAPAPTLAPAEGGGGGGGGEEQDAVESVKLFVGQVPKHMTEAELAAMFQEVALVDEVTVIKDKATKASRGADPCDRIWSSASGFGAMPAAAGGKFGSFFFRAAAPSRQKFSNHVELFALGSPSSVFSGGFFGRNAAAAGGEGAGVVRAAENL